MQINEVDQFSTVDTYTSFKNRASPWTTLIIKSFQSQIKTEGLI